MKNNRRLCDESLISRFIDGEVTPEEKALVEAHLAECEKCQNIFKSYENISMLVCQSFSNSLSPENTPDSEHRIIGQLIDRSEKSFWGKFSELFKFGKILVPVGALAAFLIIWMMPPSSPPITAKVPSAIISSVTGNMASVMIFETPETRQTIVWIRESDQ